MSTPMVRPFQEREGQLWSGQVAAGATQDTPCFASKQGAQDVVFFTWSDQAITIQKFRVDSNGADRALATASNVSAGTPDQSKVSNAGAGFYFLRIVNGGGSPANVTVDVTQDGVS